MILYGSSSVQLATDLSRLLGISATPFETKVFPDGESYVRLPKIGEVEKAIVVNTMYPNQDKRLVETLLMCNALKRNGVRKIVLVTPYLAYARQDKVFLPGEPVSPQPIGQALKCAGVDEMFVVEAHSDEAVTALGLECHNVRVIDSMSRAISSLEEPPQVVAAPDEKASRRAKAIADRLGLELFVFSKQRNRLTGEVVTRPNIEVDVRGKTVVFVDDIISTGGSIAYAARMLKESGAHSVFAVCVHALMVGGAEERLASSGVTRVVGSNTVEGRFTGYSVAPELAQQLQKIASKSDPVLQ
ncbi:MAG: ribose-phosphate diphosphokinase [Thermoprotei archaeon]